MEKYFSSIWYYRNFIISSIKTEVMTKYVRSKLGFIWMLVQPLSMVLIYTLVLSQIMSAKLPGVGNQYGYPIYILSGIIAWTLFSEIFQKSLTIFIDNSNILKKMLFPRIALPIIIVGSASINFIAFIITTFLVLGFLGHYPFSQIYWIPVLYVLTVMLALGTGMLFGILNVFIRDIGLLLPILLQFGFWLTPIVYTTSIIPKEYLWIYDINPLVGIIKGFNSVFLLNKTPDINFLIYPFIFSIVSMILTIYVYKKSNQEMVDVL